LVYQITLLLCTLLGNCHQENTPTAAPWQQSGVCGVNAVFFLLKCNGADVGEIDYINVLNATTFSADAGASINELRDVCERFGMPCQNLKTTPRTALHKFSPPYIAHWDDTQYGGKGHYVVVLSIEEDNVRIADCGPCIVASIPESQFIDLSSGYFVVPLSSLKGPSSLNWYLLGGGVGCALFSVLYVARKWFFQKSF
jgi:hypothetical protein